MKRTHIIIAVGVFALMLLLYGFLRNNSTNDSTPSPEASGTKTGILPTDTILYFTAAGCASFPYVSTTSTDGAERVPLEPFPATDGYDYSAIEGTREVRTMLSRFTGECEETSPSPLDSFQALEVGITGSDEEIAEESI